VKERVDAGESTEEAVRTLFPTACTITSAALVMVGVFALFASVRLLPVKQPVSARGRGVPRRDGRTGGAASGRDEATRRLELVPPARLSWLPSLEAGRAPARRPVLHG
jgi:hypothetical protein